MDRAHLEPLGQPSIVENDGNLLQVVQRYKCQDRDYATPEKVKTRLLEDRGTPHPNYPKALLIDQKLEGADDYAARQNVLVRVYQELGDAPVEIGQPDETLESNGRRVLTRRFLAKVATARQAIGTATTHAGNTYYLFSEEHKRGAVAAEFIRRYVDLDAGEYIFSRNTSVNERGVKTVSTQSLVLESQWNATTDATGRNTSVAKTRQDGVVTISRQNIEIASALRLTYRIAIRLNGALERITETGIGPSGGSEPSWQTNAPPATLIEQGNDDDGTTMVYTRTWVRIVGDGIINQTNEIRNNGALTVRTIDRIGSAPATPAGFALIETQERKEEGLVRYTYQFALGSGVVSTRNRPGPASLPGTTLQEVVQLGSGGDGNYSSDVREENGITIYTDTFLSGTPVTLTYPDRVPVREPGTVQLTSTSTPSGQIAIIKHEPPRRKEVQATVTVSYTTNPSSSEETIAYDLSGLGCSVTAIKTDKTFVRSVTNSASAGGIISTSKTDYFVRPSSARHVNYPECYIQGPSSISAEEEYPNGRSQPNKTTTKLIASGSLADTVQRQGLLRSVVTPVLTLRNGTTYYRVQKWTV